jgi:hypothetical protein
VIRRIHRGGTYVLYRPGWQGLEMAEERRLQHVDAILRFIGRNILSLPPFFTRAQHYLPNDSVHN